MHTEAGIFVDSRKGSIFGCIERVDAAECEMEVMVEQLRFLCHGGGAAAAVVALLLAHAAATLP